MTEIKENIKQITTNLKSKIEELELQMHLGKKESLDEFENQKEKMTSFIHQSEDSIKHAQDISSEKMQSLRTKMDEMKVQLALGRAETKEKLEEQRSNLNHSMQELQHEFSDIKSKAGEKTGAVTDKMSEYFEEFKTKMDIFRLNVALGSADAKDEWSDRKKEIQNQLHTMKNKLNDTTAVGEEKLGEFGKEMSESFSHLKSAFKKLI